MSTTPRSERAALAWTSWYTRGLPADVTEARRAELTSDLYEHRTEARETGVSERRTSVEILTRLVEGMAADVSWRRAQRSRARSTRMTIESDRRGYPLWLTIVAALMGAFALLAGTAGGINALVEADAETEEWALLMVVTGVLILGGLWLASRAPLASVVMVVLGAIGFAFAMFWMVFTVVAGALLAVAVLLCAPRVLGTRPAT